MKRAADGAGKQLRIVVQKKNVLTPGLTCRLICGNEKVRVRRIADDSNTDHMVQKFRSVVRGCVIDNDHFNFFAAAFRYGAQTCEGQFGAVVENQQDRDFWSFGEWQFQPRSGNQEAFEPDPELIVVGGL